jgi:8-oxo-dGTP pyrophosphatase MutT (NUDIX family)
MIYWNNNKVKNYQSSPAFKSLSYKSMRFPIINKPENNMIFSNQQQKKQHNKLEENLPKVVCDLKSINEDLKTPPKLYCETKEFKPKVFGAIMRYKDPNTQELYYALIQGRYTRKWSFPKGHSNKGEEPYDCVKREVYEETGINNLPNPSSDKRIGFGYYYIFDVETKYDLQPQDKNEVMDKKWVTLQDMTTLQLNVDASYFKKMLLGVE